MKVLVLVVAVAVVNLAPVHGDDILMDLVDNATHLNQDTDVKQQCHNMFQQLSTVKRLFVLSDANNTDVYLNVPQVLTKNDYPAESHVVKTEDGYLVTIHRIPQGKNTASKDVVLLFRALFCNTLEYLQLKPGNAIGYKLADMGYDVWMVETRGNSYSKCHVTLQPNDAQFWNMSWDDMGRYDVPAAINYVLNKTGVDKVFVGGHSMGNTVLFVALSVHPWLNDKVRLLIALAPTTFTAHMSGPVGFLGRIVPEVVWNRLPHQSVFPHTAVDVLGYLEKSVCNTELSAKIFVLMTSLLQEYDIANLTAFPALLAHIPESDSIKTAAHFMQCVRSGKFQRFDYGSSGNMNKYGTATPPEYDLSKITAPVALFASEGDIYATPEDVQTLVSMLPNVAVFKMTEDPSFTHSDFVFGSCAPEQVYQHVYNIMEEY